MILCLFGITSWIFATPQTTWTSDDAAHLARKTLFSPTPDIVSNLTAAWSASGAVTLLFPDQTGPNRTAYDQQISDLIATPWFSLSSRQWMNRLYQLQLYADPYEAKKYLSLLWYDIFAVNKTNEIDYSDIYEQQNLIYQYTLWNYQTLVSRHTFNNDTVGGLGIGGRGDFAVGRFIDLLRQNIDRPNENYARELLQLFLMGEYRPFDDPAVDEPLYTDQDVQTLAKKLTWLEYDSTTKQVTYNPNQRNNETGLVLLSWALLPGYTAADFPFWDPVTDTVDLSLVDQAVGWNNGMVDNTISYIFAKRWDAIAEYLAYLLYKYYVKDDVQASDQANIMALAAEIMNNNFEILPSVTWLLSRSWMYETANVSQQHYQNPTQLAVGTLKLLYQDSNDLPTNLSYHDALSIFSREPYYPGSVFGRDGFDDNDVWVNEYILNKWFTEASRIVFGREIVQWSTPIATWRIDIFGSTGLLPTANVTLSGLITDLEQRLYINRTLPASIRADMIDYATSGWVVTYDPSNSWYVDTYIRWLVLLMLIQPEFVLLHGHDQAASTSVFAPSHIAWSNKIIFLELFGWYDWIYGLIPQDQYVTYVQKRSILATPYSNMIPVWHYFMNNSLSPFDTLYNNGDMILIHGVGNPFHSRGHDTAQRQSTSYLNQQVLGSEWLFGHLIKDDNPNNTYVVWTNKPNIFSHGNYINLWYSPAQITIQWRNTWLTNTEKETLVTTIKDMLINRTIYSYDNEGLYERSLDLDTISRLPGPSAPGYNLASQLSYIHKLLDNNKGSAFYTIGGNGFDTHANQQLNDVLNNKMVDYATAVSDFFANATASGHNVTMILHTEFGRTIERNGTDGTDHGQWWGYFVITNNPTIKAAFPDQTYGNINLDLNKRDRLGVGIDYRAFYKEIFNWLYGYVPPALTSFSFATEIDTTAPRLYHLYPQFRANNNSHGQILLHGQVDDVNYRPTSMASHLFLAEWDTVTQTDPLSFWEIDNRVIVDDTTFLRTKSWRPENSQYAFVGTAMDNQHITTPFTYELTIPQIESTATGVLATQDTLFRQFDNTIVSGPVPLSLWLPLSAQKPWQSVSLTAAAWTTIIQIDGSATRHGSVILPELLETETFLAPNAHYGWSPLDTLFVSHLMRVWPDVLGTSMTTSQDVTLRFSGISNTVDVITSVDGVTWTLASGWVAPVGGNIDITTNTLQLYALVDNTTPVCTLTAWEWAGNYGYDIHRDSRNVTSWTLDPGTIALSGLSWSYAVTAPANTQTTYTLTAVWPWWTTTCDTIIDTDPAISFATPTCSISATPWTNGEYTLSRTFGSTTPLAATIQGNQDVWDIQDLSVTTTTTIPPTNALTTYTMTVLGVTAQSTCNVTIDTRVSTSSGWPSGWWGGWRRVEKDDCPDGDFSPSYYDRSCGTAPSDGDTSDDDNSDSNNNDDNDTQDSDNDNNDTGDINNTGIPDTLKEKIDQAFVSIDNTYKDNPASWRLVLNRLIALAQTKSWPIRSYIQDRAYHSLSMLPGSPSADYRQQVITWFHDAWFTVFDSYEAYKPTETIRRDHTAKIIEIAFARWWNDAQWPRGTRCAFNDTARVEAVILDQIQQLCQRQIMKGNNVSFAPFANLSRVQALTLVERLLKGPLPQTTPRWDATIMRASQDNYLPDRRDNSLLGQPITRWELADLLYHVHLSYAL